MILILVKIRTSYSPKLLSNLTPQLLDTLDLDFNQILLFLFEVSNAV